MPPIAISELELNGPIVPNTLAGGGGWSRILVRADGSPVAWMWVDRANTESAVDALARGITSIASDLARHAVRARTRPPAEDSTPPISIVVCTRAESESLNGCLESLTKLDYPQFEILLVDGAASEATMRLAARYRARYISEPNAGEAQARNRGVAEAHHDIVAFIEENVRCDPQWLRGVARGFSDPATALVTGFVAPQSLDTAAEQLYEIASARKIDSFAPIDVDPSPTERATVVAAEQLASGANMAVRRAQFHRIGGFDTALGAGTPARGGGDLDLLHRVMLDGQRLHYEPTALVWQRHPSTMSELRREMYYRGRSYGVYLMVRLRDGKLPRRMIVGQAVRWFGGLVLRIPRRFLRRERRSIPMIAAELWGALHSPYAYALAYRGGRSPARIGEAVES